LAGETLKYFRPGKMSWGGVWGTATIRSASGKGSDLSNTALTTLKMAVLAPMPRARTAIVTAANPGLLRRARNP